MNNLKVTRCNLQFELMKLKYYKRSAVIICKLNYPAVGGGYQRYPWYPDGVAYRD